LTARAFPRYAAVMFRPTPLKLILGLALVAGAYFVASNAHFDIFPCKQTVITDRMTNRVETRESECSLLQTSGRYYQPPEKAELTPVGYAVAVGVLGIVPLLLGFVLGSLFTRKKA
jgi:hypothetical protein